MFVRTLAVLSALTFPLPAMPAAQEPTAEQEPQPGDGPTQVPSDFVRFVKDGDGGHLDTAVTTYEKDGVQVVFYGAVHIADPALYQELNDRFTTCDVLLYELVGPADYRPTKDRDRGGFNPIGLLQNGMKNSMQLSFQLDEVDYQADNFVHADMTPQEFESSMAERGESLLSIMMNMMMNGMDMERELADRAADEGAGERAGAQPFDLVKAFRSGQGRHLLRITLAQQMEQMELLAAGGEGSTLLEGRNQKCLQVLKRELAKGHQRLGIYYGAAHLTDMERHLIDDFGFHKVAHEWLPAWDCTPRPDPKFDRELYQQRRQCKKDLAQLAEAGRDHRLATHPDAVPTPRELAKLQRDGQPAYAGSLVDPWGHDYVLRKRATGSRWEAVSAGADGEFGTDDDLVAAEPRRGGL
ncbi:MAG: type II secretion system protein GspG [Planctomycetes bacterium]|nr:type II secretion system protein GspG [Planctomycetota bacterium]